VERCRVVAGIGLDECRVFPVERADDVIGWARTRAIEFWETHVIPRRPPAPINVSDILAYITPDPARVVEATDVPGLAAQVSDFIELRTKAKDAESALEAAKAAIQMSMIDATTLTLEGRPAITWKPNRDSVTTDWKALVHHLWPVPPAELVEQFTQTRPGARVFRVCGSR
jgi:hypothetical protein